MKRIFIVALFLMTLPAMADGLKLKEECTNGKYADLECAKRYDNKWFIVNLAPPKGGLFCMSTLPPEKTVELFRREFGQILKIVPGKDKENSKDYRSSDGNYVVLVRGLSYCWLLTANYR